MQPPQNAALRTVIDLGLFQLLVENPDGRSAKDLAAHSGAEKALVGKLGSSDFCKGGLTITGLEVRLMRVMTALGLCASYEPEVYMATDKTRAMTEPIGRDGVPCMYILAYWNFFV